MRTSTTSWFAANLYKTTKTV